MEKKGRFIVFEGLDGAGTTTQMKRLGEEYAKRNRKVFLTHEPTDNPIGKVVRAALQKKFATTPSALALLYSSDRDDHLYNVEYGIEGHIEGGDIVISDRYFYSSYAYQSVECDPCFVKEINSRFPNADIIIFIDTPVDACLDRIEKRGEEKELFEKEEYLRAVRKNYLEVFSSLPPQVTLITIDGTKSIDRISAEIREKLEELRLL